jgi:hypothetical protein
MDFSQHKHERVLHQFFADRGIVNQTVADGDNEFPIPDVDFAECSWITIDGGGNNSRVDGGLFEVRETALASSAGVAALRFATRERDMKLLKAARGANRTRGRRQLVVGALL